MFEETTIYKRQQRRRAVIAWGVGGLFAIFFALSIIFAPNDHTEEAQSPGPSSYAMSSEEYDSLEPGLDAEEFSERVEHPGLPESHVALGYIRLFPPPEEDVTCSFWEISDRFEEVARVCFADSDGHLVQKLEHGLEDEAFGITA